MELEKKSIHQAILTRIALYEQQYENVPIQQILEHFNIYRKDYFQQFNDTWIKQHNLTNTTAFKHFKGEAVVAYLLQHSTDIFGLDLDCHYIKDEQLKLFDRLDRYHWMVDKIGQYPSLVFLSSGNNQGLHMYWKLSQKVYFPILQQALLERLDMTQTQLKRKEIEILPKDTKPLKLPYARKVGGTILDPQTLQPLIRNYDEGHIKQFADHCLNSTVFEFDDLFVYSPNISNLWMFQADKQTQYKNFQKITRLEKHMVKIVPEFENGNTNEAIEKMAFNCFVNGLDVEQALSEINRIFELKDIKRNHDTKHNALISRVNCHYERYMKQKARLNLQQEFKKQQQQEGDLFKDMIIDAAIQKVIPEATHRGTINRYRKFLTKLYDWNLYIHDLDEYHRHLFNYKYRYFYHLTKFKKAVPLPFNLLKGWNSHYDKMLERLQLSGILTLQKKYFNPIIAKEFNENVIGNCNYYRVKFPDPNEI